MFTYTNVTGKALATTAIIFFLAAPAYAQVSVSADDGIGASADVGSIGASASTADGVDADVSVGSGVGGTADVGDGSADVDASIGGPSGAAASIDAGTAGTSGPAGASVDASLGGPSGVEGAATLGASDDPGADAGVTASIGGDGSNGGIEGDAVGTLGDFFGLNVDLGIGGAPVDSGATGIPGAPGTSGTQGGSTDADDDDNSERDSIASFFTGPANDGRNDRVANAVDDMSPAQREQYRRQCRSILADQGNFDADLVTMCRMLSR